MKKNKTYRYKPSKKKTYKYKPNKNNKSKRKQGGSPKTEKNILIPSGKYQGYLGEVLQEDKRTPHGVGRMTYRLDDGTYADYLGNWENGVKHDNAGRLIVNVRNNDIRLPKYYVEGNWKNNKKEGFHELYPIKTVRDETNAYKYNTNNTKKPVKTLYFEDDKPADKKIEATIKETLDKKKVPDEIMRSIDSYRGR